MAVKIRLRQHGRTNRRVFRIVASDSRSPRDGKYLETLGWYNPHEESVEKKLFIDTTKLEKWLQNGATLSPKAESLVANVAPNIVNEIKNKARSFKEKEAKKRRERRKKAQTSKPAKAAAKTSAKAEAKAPAKPKAKTAKPKAPAKKEKTNDKPEAKETDTGSKS